MYLSLRESGGFFHFDHSSLSPTLAVQMITRVYYLLILSLFSVQGYAQRIDSEEIAYYEQRVESGRHIKKIGMSMFVPGAVMLATGIVMISTAQYDRDATGALQINDPNFSLGFALTINGLPLSAIGGIMTLAGNSKMKRAQRQLDRLSLSYYKGSGQQGVGITYRF